MLYCKPYTDLSEIRMLFPSESLDANGIYGAYTALEGDLPLGKSLVRVEGNSCRILRVETQSSDALLCELLVRASLHFAANRGAFRRVAHCLHIRTPCLRSAFRSVTAIFSARSRRFCRAAVHVAIRRMVDS